MKTILSLTVALFCAAPALQAGDACCEKEKAKAASTCEKAKASECSKAKASCCEKQVALRKTLLTHKGAFLAAK